MAAPTYTTNNDGFVSLSAKETFPVSIDSTGTITATTTSNQIVGTSTKFISLKELSVGDWIFDKTNSEIRKVTSVTSDVWCTVNKPFSNALTGVDLFVVRDSDMTKFVITFSAAGGKINSVVAPANIPVPFGEVMKGKFLDPVVVEPASGVAYISYVR